MSKAGHALIKERMRLEDAVYGGEINAELMVSKTQQILDLLR